MGREDVSREPPNCKGIQSERIREFLIIGNPKGRRIGFLKE